MSSAIPGAVANVMTIMEAALPDSTQIWFGEELGTFEAPQCFQVLGVTGDQQPAEMSPQYRREETFAIECMLVSFAGDQSSAAYLARMQEVMDLFATVEITIGNNPWLSTTGAHDATSAVRYAEVGTFNLQPMPAAEGGSTCKLSFQIHCSQRIDSLD